MSVVVERMVCLMICMNNGAGIWDGDLALGWRWNTR
jgi:hypothetical protein